MAEYNSLSIRTPPDHGVFS
uniref:Uncharacterized protein n=1 Tax=Arundo donax TaxID=35708 RepID=A0A0A9AAS7_ARUDO